MLIYPRSGRFPRPGSIFEAQQPHLCSDRKLTTDLTRRQGCKRRSSISKGDYWNTVHHLTLDPSGPDRWSTLSMSFLSLPLWMKHTGISTSWNWYFSFHPFWLIISNYFQPSNPQNSSPQHFFGMLESTKWVPRSSKAVSVLLVLSSSVISTVYFLVVYYECHY
jgi:hypothetical protein